LTVKFTNLLQHIDQCFKPFSVLVLMVGKQKGI